MLIKDNNLPLVSVIAVCYNQAPFLGDTLNSILAQTYPNIELIIMDDCSNDNSVETIQNWITRHEVNCRFIAHQENQGICKTLNEALKLCKGEYIQIIACDDLILPGKIEKQVSCFLEKPDCAAVVFSDAYLIQENGTPHYGWFIQRYKQFVSIPEGNIFEDLLEGNFIPAMACLIKKGAVMEVGGYDENLKYEDYDMWLRLARKFEFAYSSYTSAKYRLHTNNLHKKIEDFKAQKYWILKKHDDHKVVKNKLKSMFYDLYKNKHKYPKEYADFKKNYLFLLGNSPIKYAVLSGIPFKLYKGASFLLK